VRRERERVLLTGPFAAAGETHAVEPPEVIVSEALGPAESCERRERVRAAALALAALKPAERRAVGLQAAGCSYAEIAEICGWTRTKVNRCLAEGRARLRDSTATP
jgi:DNA-directed RNA polymerase specialized sigma24 family protein